MILLALDTCLASCSVAVFDGQSGHVIAAHHTLMQRGQAEAIAPMIQLAMVDAGIGFDAISAIAVTIGPGTFTGVRIGLAMAQGLALPRNLPLTAITTMQATAAPLFGQDRDITVCHAAGATGQNYVQHFSSTGAAHSDVLLQRPEEIIVSPNGFLIGTGAGRVAPTAIHKPQYDLPEAKGFIAFANSLPRVHHAQVQPLYVRDTGAKPMAAKLEMSRVGPDASNLLSALHGASFADGWSPDAIATMLETPGMLALLAVRGSQPAGFMMLRTVTGEAEILTLAVHPDQRRRGVATRLLTSSFPYLQALQAASLFLEVAADNTAGIALYERQNFMQVGLRKGYYQREGNITVDAIVMRRNF
jgi:tRNA threonylcarbamoyl adenosine modification protein YeaZ/ribosomal-protein-alanine acetyltransferase